MSGQSLQEIEQLMKLQKDWDDDPDLFKKLLGTDFKLNGNRTRQSVDAANGFDVEAMKRAVAIRCDREERGASGKAHRKHGTNYTPPKKRHRK